MDWWIVQLQVEIQNVYREYVKVKKGFVISFVLNGRPSTQQ